MHLSDHLLTLLYQHRLMRSDQLHTLLTAHSCSSRYLRSVLGELRTDGLVGSVAARDRNPTRAKVWFCTSAGAAAAEQSHLVQPRPYRLSAQKASGPHQLHALAVNDVGIAFWQWADRLADTCGQLDWIPEIAHSVSRRQTRSDLVTDALLNYTVHRDRATALQIAIELDRATMSTERLAQKLLTYTRYYQWTAEGEMYPAWRRRYSTFPQLLVVLTGRGRDSLNCRMDDVRARVAGYPAVIATRTSIHAYITTLEQLQRLGPHRSIMAPLFFPGAETQALFPAPARESAA